MEFSDDIMVLLIYTYIGYPIFIYLLGSLRNTKPVRSMVQPKVSVIVAAYNEEKYIKEKLLNALALDYLPGMLEVILVSDGSSDNTVNIAKSLQYTNLHIIEQDRSGKATAINNALEIASGEYILFTDANVFFRSDSLKYLVSSLGNPGVGAVTGKVELVALETSEPLGEGVYMRYERFLQKYETKVGSVVGTDGGMFLAKRDLVEKLPADTILDDFYIVMKIVLKKKRVVYEENAVAQEYVPASVTQEFKRKTRIAAGGFQVLYRLPRLLYFKENLWFLFQFYSHKILRWSAPILLFLLYITTFPAATNKHRIAIFISQNVFYAIALLGRLSKRLRRINIVYICYYFTAMNLAVFIGMIKAIKKSQAVTWARVDR